MKPVKDVDDYILSAPAELQDRLREIRAIIKSLAPNAEEKLSYGMPYYGYKGRLAYFAIAKSHIGLYIPPPVIEDHKRELKNYVTATATVQFPLDEKLPVSIIKKLIKARVKINEQQSSRY